MNYNSIKNKTFSENPAVKAEYDQLGPQYEVIRAAIASRKSAGLTQKQLAEKMGTAQANISRFENGNAKKELQNSCKYNAYKPPYKNPSILFANFLFHWLKFSLFSCSFNS